MPCQMHERFRMLSGLSAVQELLERVTIPRQTLDPQLMRPTDESAEEIPASPGQSRLHDSVTTSTDVEVSHDQSRRMAQRSREKGAEATRRRALSPLRPLPARSHQPLPPRRPLRPAVIMVRT